jgi:serine/threonine-protein kinase
MEAAPASVQPGATTEKVPSIPAPASTRPGGHGAPRSGHPSSTVTTATPTTLAQGKNGAKLDMDWDDDNEATHVFDKDKEKDADASSQSLASPETREPERASMDAILSSPPPQRTSQAPAPAATPASASTAAAPVSGPPAPTSSSSASLSGAFGALGQPRQSNGSSPPSAKFRSAPPASQSTRSAPPPPPTSQRNAGPQTQPLPPPPPPGQVTTAPMHMPPTAQQQPSAPAAGGIGSGTMQSAQSPMASVPHHASAPPAHHSAHPSAHPSGIPSAPPMPNLPPVSRAMEATHMVARPESSKAPLIIALLVAVIGVVGVAVFFLMPRPGTLVVNVADAKGGVVPNLEITVDGTKRCESAPCIVRDIPTGVYEVKVSAKGFEQPAPRAVTVESRRDIAADFQLVASKTSAGTGFKVSAPHAGVKLAVDGKDIGSLPQELRDLEPGEHKLRFSGDRYAPQEKTITVGKDEIVDLGTVNLQVTKGKATIQLGTPGAKVYLVSGTNRKEVPQFPMAIEFDPNEKWELQGVKDGFDDYHERISFEDGQAEKTFTVSLQPKASAAAAAPARPAPAVAAAPATPAAAPKEPAAPAPKAAAPAAAAKEEPAPAKKEAPAAAGGEAVLKINSLPASSVVLDGKPIGVTPQTHVVVSPGSHTIMFVNAEQSLKKTITVEVKAGETKAAFAKLRE